MAQLTSELESARRSVQVAKHGPPVAGGQLQRRIAELESQLATSESDVQQLTVCCALNPTCDRAVLALNLSARRI